MAEINNFKYIIMAGGDYSQWKTPRQLLEINGESLIARTIRLLKENGVNDISISSNNAVFEKFGLPILKHNNLYVVKNYKIVQGDWFNAFYPTNEPTCYIFGDVYFSDEAIKTIVETKTSDIDFFASKKPFDKNYIKQHEEPFALKVANTIHLKEAIEKTRELDKQGKFWRKPLMWELWTVIKNAPLQIRRDEYTADYITINDYTCDIDKPHDILILKVRLGGNMIKFQATEDFSLKRFNEIIELERHSNKNDEGMIYKDDVLKCEKNLAEYLCGDNALGRAVVNIIEVIPSQEVKQDAQIKENTSNVKTRRTNKSKKSKK